jgi:pentatricopeptide repeat protein
MCTNVLNTAARHKDPNLATDVVRVLTSRPSKLDVHHYEALISAYSSSSDLRTALQILSIMKKARLEPSESTTRPIYESLSKTEQLPSQVFKILQTSPKDGQAIPTAAVNVMIESCVAHGHLNEAIKQYKTLHEICPSGPNTATFNALLQGCSKSSGNKDLAMFLASEMAALGIRPDVLTYDRLVLVCLTEDDYEDAFRYLEEMKAMFDGSELRPGTFNALVKKCVAAGDKRTWGILEEMQSRGRNVEKIRRWAEKAWNVAATGATQINGWEEREEGEHRAQMV